MITVRNYLTGEERVFPSLSPSLSVRRAWIQDGNEGIPPVQVRAGPTVYCGEWYAVRPDVSRVQIDRASGWIGILPAQDRTA